MSVTGISVTSGRVTGIDYYSFLSDRHNCFLPRTWRELFPLPTPALLSSMNSRIKATQVSYECGGDTAPASKEHSFAPDMISIVIDAARLNYTASFSASLSCNSREKLIPASSPSVFKYWGMVTLTRTLLWSCIKRYFLKSTSTHAIMSPGS